MNSVSELPFSLTSATFMMQLVSGLAYYLLGYAYYILPHLSNKQVCRINFQSLSILSLKNYKYIIYTKEISIADKSHHKASCYYNNNNIVCHWDQRTFFVRMATK